MTVDELVVELSLDTTKFTEGQKTALNSFRKSEEEFEKGLKNLDAASKNVGYSFGGVTAAAQGLFGALAGAGMAAFARETMNSVAATGRMATNIGVATNELSAFGRMIERNGGKAEAAVGSMKSLTDQVERFKLLGQASNELQLFAGTIGADLNSSALDVYMKFVEWASKHRDDPKQVNVIGQLGGLDPGSINTALKGNVQVLKEFNEAMKGSITPEETKRLTDMQKAWVTLEQKIGDTGRRIESNFAPTITHTIEAVSAWDERNLKLADSLGTVLVALTALTALKPALWLLRLLGVTSPIGLAVTASAAAAAAITSYAGGGGRAGQMDRDHPWLGAIDSFFGINPNDKEAAGGGGGDMAAYRAAIANIESKGSGGYRAIGPVTASGDRAYGKYQIMGNNIGPWSQGALGRQVSIAEFMQSPDIQDRIFDHQFGGYVKKYGNPQDAASAWLTGRPLSQGANARDLYGTSGSEYVRRFNNGLAKGGGDTSVTVNVHTESKNPRDHGQIVADTVKKQLGSSITTQANAGLSN